MAENFTDLLPELGAKAAKTRDASPHRIAREFVLEQSRLFGDVEVIVVVGGRGTFLAAGTQHRPDDIQFPPLIESLLEDPAARLVIHHNHPAREEPFFSGRDMNALATGKGIEWLFLHTEAGYSAMRISDHLFKPDASGNLPATGLVAAYRAATSAAQYAMYDATDVAPAAIEIIAPELALQALQRSGALLHYSSVRTGLSHEQERTIVEQVRADCAANATRAGGIALWQEPAHAPFHTAPGRGTGRVHRPDDLFPPSTLEVEFERCLAILSRRDVATIDRGAPGRPGPSQLSSPGRQGAGMEGGSADGKPVLGARPRGIKPRF